nr:hypothetical protein [Tanacetum cinerariifolium]
METTIEQQAAIDEALVPHAQRDMLHICPRVHGAAPPKPKASARRTRNSFDTSITPPIAAASPRLTASAKGKQTAKASKAKSLSALSEVAMTKAQQLKLVTKRSRQQMHISQASGFVADEGTGANDEGKDGDDDEKDEGDDDDKDNDGKKSDDDADQEVVRDDDTDDEEEGGNDEHEFDEDESDEETKDEESFDPIPQTPKNSKDEGNGAENLGLNVGGEERHVEEEEEDELYRDVNINQGRGLQASLEVEDSHVTLTLVNPDGMESTFETTSQLDVQTPTSVAPLHMFAPTMTPSTIATITTTSQEPILPTTVSSNIIQNLPNFGSLFRFDDRLRTLEANFSEFIQANQFAGAVSAIPGIAVNEQLEAEVLTRSSHLSRTSYAVAADLSEMELKRILIEMMEGNKSIQRSDEQKNLYKALVEAYESDKIILDTYGETVTLKRRRDDDAEKDEEPSAGPDRGLKRRKEGKEPDKSALIEEPMQTTSQMEEPSHSEFDTCAEDQPIVQSSQHPEWFSQQQKPPSSDRAWNQTVLAIHSSIQPWISELAKQTDSRSSFNELLDTPLDFSNFLINRLKVDTLTPELIAGPTYELIKRSCKSLVELEYHLEEVFKATTDQLDWVNPEGQQYPHNLLKPLPLIPNNRGRRVIPFEHFINKDLKYLRGGASSRKYTTSITKMKAADYGHIKWIEDLVPKTMWIEKPIGYDNHTLWGRRIIAVTELKIVEWHSYKHLDWIMVQRDDDKLYKFKEGDFKRLRIQDIEDMLLLLVQGKLTNLTNKDKKNRLTRIDELHKFSDGTLTDVRTALDDRLKGNRMQYLPQSIWRKSVKYKAATMIQDIDKRLKTRRIMKSLERFIGGRLYEGDFRMLQRTILFIV